MSYGNFEFNTRTLCQAAAGLAGEQGKNLNFSKASILELEEIMEHYSSELKQTNAPEDRIIETALIFGAYLGETLLRNHLAAKGFTWAVEGGNLPKLYRDYQNSMFPVDKAYKRLKNGREDSVSAFYDVAVMIAEERLKPQNP